MEDHLTNKARLDTEWAALCAYDADPCSVAIAQQVSVMSLFEREGYNRNFGLIFS